MFFKKSKKQEAELIKQISILNALACLKEELTKLNEPMNGFDMRVSLKDKVVKLNDAMSGFDMPVSLKDKVVELNNAIDLDMSVSLKDKATELNEAINGILDKSELALLNDQLKACQNFNKISHRKLSLFIWALHGVKLAFPYQETECLNHKAHNRKPLNRKPFYDDLYVNQSILVLLNAILDDIADQAQMPRAVELAISIFPNEKLESMANKEGMSMDKFNGVVEDVSGYLSHQIDSQFQEFIPVKEELIDYLVFAWQIYTDSFESFTRGIHDIYYIKKLEIVFKLEVDVVEKLSQIISEDDFPTFDVTPEQKIGLKIFFEELDYSVSDKKGLKDHILNQFETLGIYPRRARSQSIIEKETILRRLVTSSRLIFNNFLVGARFNEVPSHENALLFKASAPHNMNMIAFAQMVTIYNHAFAGIPVKDTNEFLARKEINDLLAYNQRLGRIGNNIATAFTRELKEDCDFSGVVDILSDLLVGVWPEEHNQTIEFTESIVSDPSYGNRKQQTEVLVGIFDRIDARAYMKDSYITTLSQYEAQLFELYSEINARIQKTKLKIEQINSESLDVLFEFIMDSNRFRPIVEWLNDKRKAFEDSDLTLFGKE